MREKTLKQILEVVASNIVSLLAGILVAFLLPKTTTLMGFGYYKTFTLYISYVGLLHFGFCDGVYLKYGGQKYDNINPYMFRMYFQVLTLMELMVSFLIIVGTLLFVPSDLKFVFVGVAIYALFHIYSSYYQLVSQATSRFGEFSLRTIIYSTLRVCGVAFLWIYTKKESTLVSHKAYIIFMILLEIALAVWYLYTYRNISFGKHDSFIANKTEVLELFKTGFPLLVANLASTLLLTLDRQFVNILFSKEVYAIYAFAYSMLALVTTATSAVAVVLFPKLKRASEQELAESYSSLTGVILIVVYFGLLGFFPLNCFIEWFLPNYIESLTIFRIIFPGLAISSTITIVMYNYYKVLGLSALFLRICIGILVLSGIANYLAYSMYHSTIAISIASIFMMIIWYLISERYYVKRFGIKWTKNFVYLIIMMLCFYIITCIKSNVIGCVLYLIAFIGVTLVLYNRMILLMIKERGNKL